MPPRLIWNSRSPCGTILTIKYKGHGIMYFGNSASASRRYAAIDTGSKVEGANPHQLVKILFDELLLAIDSSIVADKAGDRSKCSEKQARALSIDRKSTRLNSRH